MPTKIVLFSFSNIRPPRVTRHLRKTYMKNKSEQTGEKELKRMETVYDQKNLNKTRKRS